MIKAAFIIPYFGVLPDFFSEWKYSASFLKNHVDFFIITDDYKNVMLDVLPTNIMVMPMSFNSFREYIQRKFDFEIQIPNPYKICDFRPAFGYIFEEILKQYDFWGHCDLDQVWGNYEHFISQDILKKYDKILYLGHFSLHKNTEKMRTMFMNDGGMADYREVFSTPSFYAFDEFAGMVSICKRNEVRTYYKKIYADISVMQSRVTLRKLQNYQKQIIYWKDGSVFRSFVDNGAVVTEEYMYCHYQKKHPVSIGADIHHPKAFIIQGNKFVDISNEEINVEMINKFSDFLSVQKDNRDRLVYYMNKISLFIKSSYEDKKIWMRRKIFAKKL